MATTTVSGADLKTPLQTSLPPNDPTIETSFVAEIKKRIENSKNPVIIVDGGKHDHICFLRGVKTLYKERHSAEWKNN